MLKKKLAGLIMQSQQTRWLPALWCIACRQGRQAGWGQKLAASLLQNAWMHGRPAGRQGIFGGQAHSCSMLFSESELPAGLAFLWHCHCCLDARKFITVNWQGCMVQRTVQAPHWWAGRGWNEETSRWALALAVGLCLFFEKKMQRRVCFPWECVGFPVHGQGHEYGHNRAFHPCMHAFVSVAYSIPAFSEWFGFWWYRWSLSHAHVEVLHVVILLLQVLPCQPELCHWFGSCWSLSCFLVVLLDYILLIWKLLLCVVTSFEFVENMNRRNMNQQLLRYIIVLLTYTLQVPKNVEYLLLTTTELNIC